MRDRGDKAFVPYVTGGYPGVDAALLRELSAIGADAIEVGIPHSDPIIDGGVVQEASRVALASGTHPRDVLAMIAEANVDVPVAVMTYANIVTRPGLATFCDEAAGAGVSGLIVPDLPVDEAAELDALAVASGIDMVLLAAPGTASSRYAAIGAASHGFVYCVATYGVTGARQKLSSTAREVVDAMRGHTDLPLLAGVGIATPEHAAAACGFADGVIVGSALMARLLEGDRSGLIELASSFRAARAPTGA
ncbi:MAG: tryptophan synthase subunit alpha [Actinomycetota bacterium]